MEFAGYLLNNRSMKDSKVMIFIKTLISKHLSKQNDQYDSFIVIVQNGQEKD